MTIRAYWEGINDFVTTDTKKRNNWKGSKIIPFCAKGFLKVSFKKLAKS